MNPGGVGNPTHEPIHGIDLSNEVALSKSADRWIARHDSNGIAPMGHQRRLSAKARCAGSGFASRMPATDDDDIEP
ncbi:hypothetical protein J2W42_003875 [Rhizobium tibeticum]|nr:hypothetical protein [Rhizobium tibeticum]